MKLDAQEQRNGTVWFISALLIGLAMTVALATVDLKLTHSDKELRHADMLRELRIAQSSIATGSVDPRKK